MHGLICCTVSSSFCCNSKMYLKYNYEIVFGKYFEKRSKRIVPKNGQNFPFSTHMNAKNELRALVIFGLGKAKIS